MAASAKLTASLLLLSLLFIQIHARESTFFSKVPNTIDNNSKETQTPDKIDPSSFSKEEIPRDQEPNFIPQTQDNGYGLYGHESGQLPPFATKFFSDPTTETGGKSPSTTTNYNNYKNYKTDIPQYRTESEAEYYNNNNDNNDNGFQNSNSKVYDNSFYYNKDLYEGGRGGRGRESFDNVKLSRDDDFTNTPSYNQQNNRNYYSPSNVGDNVQRQGLSDTRFMENGKYYYDLSYEPHHYKNSRNWNNNDRGYSGNTNTYEYSTKEGYPNESEFQEEPNEFAP